ncbi:MAG: trypsin-like peptidase domain-containing protein [Dolichospermum sp.]
MRLINGLAATVIGVTVILVQPQNTAALDGGEINNIAKQITVKIDSQNLDSQNQGTGIIVNKAGNRYTVLTNHHVVREQGKYILITPDGKKYNFNSSDIKKLPDLDLAVVEFTSNDNYTVATLGDSDKLTESTPIYNAGWSVNDSRCLKGCYRFYNGIINGISPNPQEGYALIMSNNTLPGMSGGPILNAQGELVGINGQSFKNEGSNAVDFDGILINKYKVAVGIGNKVDDPPSSRTTNNPPARNLARVDYSKFNLVRTLSSPTYSSDTFSNEVRSVAISADGRTLVSGSMNKTMNIWNLETGELIRTLSGHSSSFDSVAISPDGKTLASGSFDKTIKIWNLGTGQLIRTLSGHSYSVQSVAISADGQTLVSGSGDETIKIWNLGTGELIRTLSGHSKSVNSVAWSPDGRTLASGSGDNTIKIWDGRTGNLLGTLSGHSYSVSSVAWSPGGRTLASGSWDNTIKIWRVSGR